MKNLLTALITFPLMGCAGTYACKGFPQFAACKSASQAYKATNRNVPDDRLNEGTPEDRETRDQRVSMPSMSMARSPERSPAQTLKIWKAPYEDDNGDLVGSSTVLAEIEPRRWRLAQSGVTVPRRLVPLQVAQHERPSGLTPTEDRGGFPLFQTQTGPRRLQVEEVDYREP